MLISGWKAEQPKLNVKSTSKSDQDSKERKPTLFQRWNNVDIGTLNVDLFFNVESMLISGWKAEQPKLNAKSKSKSDQN